MSAQEFEGPPETFDAFAEEYDVALTRGISVSGESKEFFAEARVEILRGKLLKIGFAPKKILDFGCGTGSAVPFLEKILSAQIVGVEVSEKSIEIAKRLHKSQRVSFALSSEDWVDGSFDLAFCNGVFHHIPPKLRQTALFNIWNSMRPGAFFAFWENNPWNPGTRIVMSRIPFDRDAQTISPIGAKKLLSAAGFEIIEVCFHFYFPKCLAFMRKIEPFLGKIPLGAQYFVFCRKN